MARKSHIYDFHKQYGKQTEFGGFEMPLWYKGIIDEHNAVRNAAGLFDVSHMGRIEIEGVQSTEFLNYVLPSDASRYKERRAFYSMICNDNGGIVDDTITNKFSSTHYLMVVNAANRGKDYAWLKDHSQDYSLKIRDVSDDIALIAFQGPLAQTILQRICDVELDSVKRSTFAPCKLLEENCLVSRTGYTGEDGFEIAIYDTTPEDPKRALLIWNRLLDLGREKGVLPCGLGARDSLRLEAGMCLYGQDIDDTTTPVEADLGYVIAENKSEGYVGSNIIARQLREGVKRKRVAFSLYESGIPRHGHDVNFAGKKIGTVTSGSFSPTIRRGIGMGYVPPDLSTVGSEFTIKVRGLEMPAQVVGVPFYDTTKFGYKRKQPPSHRTDS